jgi:hypothetical protein
VPSLVLISFEVLLESGVESRRRLLEGASETRRCPGTFETIITYLFKGGLSVIVGHLAMPQTS